MMAQLKLKFTGELVEGSLNTGELIIGEVGKPAAQRLRDCPAGPLGEDLGPC